MSAFPQEQFEACERAAIARSRQQPERTALVFLREDGEYGWQFDDAPYGARIVGRYQGGNGKQAMAAACCKRCHEEQAHCVCIQGDETLVATSRGTE